METATTPPRRPAGRASLAAAALLAGCGGDPDPASEVPAAAVESVEGTVAEGAFLLAAGEGLLVSGVPGGLPTRARVAAFVAGRIAAGFRPAGCATATSAGGTVDLTLRACESGYGLTGLDGAVAITYEVTGLAPLALAVTLRSAALRVDGLRLGVDVDAAVSFERATTAWSLAARTRTAGLGRRGQPFTRTGAYTLRWEPDPRCAAVDGDWVTTAAPLGTFSTRVTGLRSCMGRCPQVGGVAVLTGGAPADVVTITYTGSATAQWRRASGGAGTVSLACEN